jgi:hypothetical protein
MGASWLIVLVIQSLLNPDRSRDFVVIRRGLLIFVAFALWDNIAGAFRYGSKIEPFGFVAFLAALGYVAARQIMDRTGNSTLFTRNSKWLAASSCPFCRRSSPVPRRSASLRVTSP